MLIISYYYFLSCSLYVSDFAILFTWLSSAFLFLGVSVTCSNWINDIFPSLRFISFKSLIIKYGGTAIKLIYWLLDYNFNVKTKKKKHKTEKN